MSLPGLCPETGGPHVEATMADVADDPTIPTFPYATCIVCRATWVCDTDGKIIARVKGLLR